VDAAEVWLPELDERAKRKILGLNNARLYGIKNVNGRLVTQDRDCEDENDHRYHPVPWNFESLIPISLKHTMEFPQFALNDFLSKLRERYLAAGPRRATHGTGGSGKPRGSGYSDLRYWTRSARWSEVRPSARRSSYVLTTSSSVAAVPLWK
jgi:hypothetical protein